MSWKPQLFPYTFPFPFPFPILLSGRVCSSVHHHELSIQATPEFFTRLFIEGSSHSGTGTGTGTG